MIKNYNDFKECDKVIIIESAIAGLTNRIGIFKEWIFCKTPPQGTRAKIEVDNEYYYIPNFLIRKKNAN